VVTRYDLVWIIWGLLFVGLEFAAIFGAPWHTLSTDAWDIEMASSWLRIIIAAGLFILLLHIVFRFPN
jgi:hypothetical protein